MRPSFRTLLASAVILGAAVPTWAHHRQTGAVLPLTTSGDTPLSRQAVVGRGTVVLAVEAGTGKQIVTLAPFRPGSPPTLQTLVAASGDHSNPAISNSGRSVAFESGSDPLSLGLPGQQIVGAAGPKLFAATSDPSGSSQNPTIDGAGRRIAFESTSDLASTGNPGSRQVFVRDQDGTIRQLSRGMGTSRNPVISAKRDVVVFESSSHAVSGVDTGVAQVWVGNVATGIVDPITAGAGASTNPTLTYDGRLVAFESTANLEGTQTNTGIARIYIYDTISRTYARLTNDATGCHVPSVHKIQNDWRVAYVCNGAPYFTMLRADGHYRISTPGGVTQRIIAGMGVHFVLLSTTADLSDGAGTTAGSQVYLVNLFKRPAVPVPGSVVWFPTQGIPPL